MSTTRIHQLTAAAIPSPLHPPAIAARTQPSGGSTVAIQYSTVPLYWIAATTASIIGCPDIFVWRATPTSTLSVSSLMPDPYYPSYHVYQDQLSDLSQGVALWIPSPPRSLYNCVSIGDVGYLQEGTFIRMFNVMLPYDDPSNQTLGKPEPYDPLDCGPFSNILKRQFDKVDYSHSVTEETNVDNAQALGPDE